MGILYVLNKYLRKFVAIYADVIIFISHNCSILTIIKRIGEGYEQQSAHGKSTGSKEFHFYKLVDHGNRHEVVTIESKSTM